MATGEHESAQNEEPMHLKELPAKVTHRPVYFHEGQRTVCIVYDYDREEQILKYGATIHRKEGDGKDEFQKKPHRQTAIGRLEKRPVVVANFEDSVNIKDFNKRLRKLLPEHHVRGERVRHAA